MQLIARIATLVPPPRMHRHRYFGVMAQPATRQTEPATTGEGTQIRKILDHIGVDSEPPRIWLYRRHARRRVGCVRCACR